MAKRKPTGRPHRSASRKEPAQADSHQEERFPVIGVGASAGGLEALTHLLQALPEKPGLALVLIQHLAPDHDPYSTLVYAARGSDVRTTIVGGDVLVDEFAPIRVDQREVMAEARSAAEALARRAGL